MVAVNGFVKFDRKIKNWGWYTDINTFKLFFHLVTFANFKEEEFLGKVIKRGQIAKSLSSLASETGLTVNEIRTAIKHLESTKEITSTSQGKYTLFTVTNYDLYQTDSQAFNNDLTTESQSINNRLTTNEEYKNIRTKEYKEKINKKESHDEADTYTKIVDMYHSICISLPKLRTVTEKRKKIIKARLKQYSIEQFEEVFILAESSDFLKGTNGKWNANFDWLMNENNFIKVLEGNYNNKTQFQPAQTRQSDNDRFMSDLAQFVKENS